MERLNLTCVADLGLEPDTDNHMNGTSAVQDCIVSYRGWQYVGYWRDAAGRRGVRHLVLSRREFGSRQWNELVFTDHEQVEDDGHNTVSIGLCRRDGTIHLSYDLHSSPFLYRYSTMDLISNPKEALWATQSFTETCGRLPGLEDVDYNDNFYKVTYPRFLSLPDPNGALALEYRVGISGLGDCLLFIYDGDGSRSWRRRGLYLKGVDNNPYLNGIDVGDDGSLHVSWCYRDYVQVTDDGTRQHSGPNGPENNHDVLYAWSPVEIDGSGPGIRWFGANGSLVGTADISPILPDNWNTMAWEVPKFTGGALNSEGQTVDWQGGIHVLNREAAEGLHSWFHYYLPPKQHAEGNRAWKRRKISVDLPSPVSARGKLVTLKRYQSVLLALPLARDLVILAATHRDGFERWRIVGSVARAGSCEHPTRANRNLIQGTEVLIDSCPPGLQRARADLDSSISLFVGVTKNDETRKHLCVLDFCPT